MPSRVIRGEINSSASLAAVSLEADLTFRALICSVDDYGRADARPAMLKAALFPLRESVTPADVMEWIAELERARCVQIYEFGGRFYLQLTGWEKHRGNSRRAKESKFPPPNTGPIQLALISSDIREIPGDPPGSRESGVGSRESRDGETAPASPSPPEVSNSKPEPPRARTRCPENLSAAGWDRVKAWRNENHPEISDAELGAQWERHRNHARDKGKRSEDWPLSFENWLTSPFYSPALKTAPRPNLPVFTSSGQEPPPPMTPEEIDAMKLEQRQLREDLGLNRARRGGDLAPGVKRTVACEVVL